MDLKKVEVLMEDRTVYRELINCLAHDIVNAMQNLSADSLEELVESLSIYSDELVSVESELKKITGVLPCNFNQLLKKGDEVDENS